MTTAAQDSEGTRPMRVGRDWRRPSAPGDWVIHWRRSDGFGQILPRPTPEEAAAFYAVDYYTHNDPDADGAPPGFGQRLLSHLAWRADRSVEPDAAWWSRTLGPEPLDVLEVGSGNGDRLRLFEQLGHRVTGVEPDAAARAQSGEAEVHPGTAESLPPEVAGRRYDVVAMLHVLEHCIDPALALANVAALLRPGGRLVVEVPNNACRGAALFGRSWYWLDVPRHLNFFTPESLRTMVEGAGLAVTATEFTGYVRQFDRSWRAAQARIGVTLGDPRGGQGWRYPALLLASALGPASRKYDSVRIVATPAPGARP